MFLDGEDLKRSVDLAGKTEDGKLLRTERLMFSISIALYLVVIAIIALLFWSHCRSSRPSRRAQSSEVFILHDTVYHDYLLETPCRLKAGTYSTMWGPHELALRMSFGKALSVLEQFRVREMGEYADTGRNDYPIIVERE